MQALYNQLCEATLKAHEHSALCRASAAFHAALLCEVLQASQPPSDRLLQATIPHLLPGLTPSASPHLRAATLAAAACMLVCTTLSHKVAAALVSDACCHVHAGNARQTLLFVAHALASQRALREPPLPAAAALLRMPGVADEVSAARRAGLRVDAAAASLVCLAPLLLEPPSDPDGPPLVPLEEHDTVHETALELVRGLRFDTGAVHVHPLCAKATLALAKVGSDAAAALASAIVGELRGTPECADVLETAAQQAVEGVAEAGRQRVYAAMAGLEAPGPQELPIGRELMAALQADVGSTAFESTLVCLKKMKADGGLDARMHARVADVALGALRSAAAQTVAVAAGSPLLELLPKEETVPELLACLQASMRRIAKSLRGAEEVAGAVAEGRRGGGMLWKLKEAVHVALACLKTLSGLVTARVEWEKAVVALVLPGFLVAQQWPERTLAEAAELLSRLGVWGTVFGGNVPAALLEALPAEGGTSAGKGKKQSVGRGPAAEGGENVDVAGEGEGATAAEEQVVGSKKESKKARKGGGGVPRGAALRALQAGFAATVTAQGAEGAVVVWETLVEVAGDAGMAGRHIAAVTAAVQACAGDVAQSELTRSCLEWLVVQLLREGGQEWPEAELCVLQKGAEVVDQNGVLTVWIISLCLGGTGPTYA